MENQAGHKAVGGIKLWGPSLGGGESLLALEELLKIQQLPENLRTNHCYNDLQHSMLVILFRHALSGLKQDNMLYADRVLDNTTLYLYIHFLNEEEGMVYKRQQGLIDNNTLKEHSESHVAYLAHWKNKVLLPHKSQAITRHDLTGALAQYYNVIIKHIDETDNHDYGQQSTISEDQTRNEMAQIYKTRMPMSPFMAGAFETVNILAPDVARVLNHKNLSPVALKQLNALNMTNDVGRILNGQGSIRDIFFAATRGRDHAVHLQSQLERVA